MPVNPRSLANLRQNAGKSAAEIERSIGAAVPDSSANSQTVGATAVDILRAAEPVAAAHLHNIASGRAKVPAHVRAQVCLEVLGRVLKPKLGEQPAAQPPGIAAALEALGRALALRERAAKAEDAEVASTH